ncbi:Single-stranded DNA-binding protein [Thermoflexales bacterium]|nr:Single-stranded DNA-binding protein [Thermoflexales bacterium]
MGQKNGYQRLVVLGNLGRDAELTYTQSGKPLAKFSLAVTTGYGENTHTEWFNVAKLGEGLENLVQYLKKGKGVLVEGKLKTTSREDEHGQKKYWTTLWADAVTLMADGNGNGNASRSEQPADDDVPVGKEGDIPF